MSHRSRGCLRCRQRRVKCDRSRPSCQRCLTRNELCVGYRDEADLLFQDETQKVVSKSTSSVSSASVTSTSSSAGSRRTRSRSVEASPTTPALAVELPSSRPWLKEAPRVASLEDEAVSLFMDAYVIQPCAESSSPGFLEHLPCLFGEVNVAGRCALRWAVQAAAFANLARGTEEGRAGGKKARDQVARRALECYGEALGALGKSLAERGKPPDDYDLMAVVVLDIFETLFMPDSTGAAAAAHAQGMANILRLRGHEQFYDARGWGLFRLAHHRLQKQQLAKQLPPLPESTLWLAKLDDAVPSVRLEKDALHVSTLCHHANELLGALNKDAAATPEQLLQLVAEMLRLDRQAAAWRDAPEWAFRTLPRSEIQGSPEDGVAMLPDEVQIHRDLWMAYEWNYHRTARIILHQRLLACLDRTLHAPLDEAAVALVREAQSSSQQTIERLADDILSTVPQLLGDVDHLGRCRAKGPAPRGQAIGAYFLLWPVKVVKSEGGRCTEEQRGMARGVFGRIRECTGMKTRLGGLSDV